MTFKSICMDLLFCRGLPSNGEVINASMEAEGSGQDRHAVIPIQQPSQGFVSDRRTASQSVIGNFSGPTARSIHDSLYYEL